MNFLIKKFSPAILIISFFLLIYTFYRSEILYNGAQREYYYNYYLISLALIFFSLITFFISQKIKEYLIISIVSLIASLYFFEGYLTLRELKEQHSKDQPLAKQLYKNQVEKKWDTRTKIKIYQDLKKINPEITISVGPQNYLNKSKPLFPLSGISNSETIYCNENGYYSIYQSDRYGFNNPDEEWEKKEIEYLLIGDSFTHGACVNRPNDIASVLRTLSKKSVLNLGYSSNGPLIEYATLREYLKTNVKKILYIYYEGNDLSDLENEKRNNILIKYLQDLDFTQNLKFKQNEIDSLLSNLIKEKKSELKSEREKERERQNFKFKLINFIKISYTRYLIMRIPAQLLTPAPAPEFKKIIQLTKELTNKNNSKLYFVYLPQINRYKTPYYNRNYNLIKNIVTELKIPFIDVHKEVFEKEQIPLKLFPFKEAHYNVEGYKKVAETIYKLTKD